MNKKIKLFAFAFLSFLLFTSIGADDLAESSKNQISILDEKILEYNKQFLKDNKEFVLKEQTITKKEPLGDDSRWIVYTLELQVVEKKTNRQGVIPYFLFSNGQYITTLMTNLDTNKRYGEISQTKQSKEAKQPKEELSEEDKERAKFEKEFVLEPRYFTKWRFIAGKHPAKTKVAIFSNPLCTHCVKVLPILIDEISKRDDIALYYFNVPMDDIFPTSTTVIQAIEASKKFGVKDSELKIYKANLENFYDTQKTTNKKVALDAVNEVLGTKITFADLQDMNVTKRVANDSLVKDRVQVLSTPTILINGSHLNAKEKLIDLLK